MLSDDTIAAIASPAGEGARGIIRISGSTAIDCVSAFFAGDEFRREDFPPTESQSPAAQSDDLSSRVSHPAMRARSYAGAIALPTFGAVEARVYLWPDRRSYTREPLVEIHTLASPPILAATLRAACSHGARLARPGEFTLRAFLSGRIDLAQAEGVLGVIDSRSDSQLHAALGQLAGGISRPIVRLRSDLLDLLADLEAGLDFVEDDIEFVTSDVLRARLAQASGELAASIDQLATRSALVDAPRVVLRGMPNAGKSSLFNAIIALTERESPSDCKNGALAIVDPQPGATRDYLTRVVQVNGVAFELVDTAGIEDLLSNASNEADKAPAIDDRADSVLNVIQSAAQQQASSVARQAEIVIWCVETGHATSPLEHATIEQGKSVASLMVATKCDLATGDPPANRFHFSVSAHSGVGLSELIAEIAMQIATIERASEGAVNMGERSRESLIDAAASLDRAAKITAQDLGHDLVAIELRDALDALGRVVGVVYTDDMLDRLFSRFCIGK